MTTLRRDKGIFIERAACEVFTTFCFLLLSPVLGPSQSMKGPKPDFKFLHVNRELSNNQVFTIFQDRYGFFWAGTLGGLHRFKGEDHDLFVTSKDTTSIPDSRVEELFEDKHGNLWVGTHDGVARYNRDKDNFTRFDTPNDLANPLDVNTNRVKEIVEDSDGILWVVGHRSGLSYFDEETQSFIPFFSKARGNALETTNLTAICPGKNNSI